MIISAAVSVEPTYSYYEKVSEELERIVHEVQEKEEVEFLSDGEKRFSLQSCKKCYFHSVISSKTSNLVVLKKESVRQVD